METRSHTSPDIIASGVVCGTIHLTKEPNPPRRSERLKRIKRVVDSSHAYAERSSSLVYQGKNHCSTSPHATEMGSVKTIEPNDSDDSMTLCEVIEKWRAAAKETSRRADYGTVYPGKNRCNTSPHATETRSVKMIEPNDSDDSMTLCRVIEKGRVTSQETSRIANSGTVYTGKNHCNTSPHTTQRSSIRTIEENDFDDSMPPCLVTEKWRAVSKKKSRVADSGADSENDTTGKQSTMETRIQTSPDILLSSFATRTIHLHEEPNPPRRSERLKLVKQVVYSSNAYAQRSSSPLCPGKNHCNTIGHAKGTIGSSNSIRSKYMLNDKLFCYYMEHIWNQFSEMKRDSFTRMDSCWFHLYAEDERKKAVLGWIKRLKIFSKKYVLVPIVIWSHWNLLIFCNFGESLESTRKTPCMLLLDSLQAMDPLRLEPLIRRFVIDIFRIENRPEKKELIRKIPLLIPKVPQQIDDKKCGYFVLYYINLFIKEAPEEFSINEGYPYFMKEDWFTYKGLDNFCRSLDSIELDDY